MAKKAFKKGPVHLRFEAGDILVSTKDSDRFVMAKKRAIEALQLASAVDQMMERFSDEYLPHVFNWCVEHKDKVSACYLGPPSAPVLPLFVVGTKGAHDFELGEAIAALERDLEDAGWSSDILQIPKGTDEDLRGFFNPEDSLQVYTRPE